MKESLEMTDSRAASCDPENIKFSHRPQPIRMTQFEHKVKASIHLSATTLNPLIQTADKQHTRLAKCH